MAAILFGQDMFTKQFTLSHNGAYSPTLMCDQKAETSLAPPWNWGPNRISTTPRFFFWGTLIGQLETKPSSFLRKSAGKQKEREITGIKRKGNLHSYSLYLSIFQKKEPHLWHKQLRLSTGNIFTTFQRSLYVSKSIHIVCILLHPVLYPRKCFGD